MPQQLFLGGRAGTLIDFLLLPTVKYAISTTPSSKRRCDGFVNSSINHGGSKRRTFSRALDENAVLCGPTEAQTIFAEKNLFGQKFFGQT